MSKDTDYKRLWRNVQEEKVELLKLIDILNGQLEAQRILITKIRDGEIKIEDIIQYMPKDFRKNVMAVLKSGEEKHE